MQSTPHRVRPFFAPGATLLLALSAYAQPTPLPTPTPASDDVVALSEFTVRERTDNRYLPAESTTGSRVAVKVIDLPYAVNSITSEQLRDFNILDVTEEASFASSVNGLDQGGNFNIRGFGGNITLRNGFSRLGNFDRTSADRIEFIKGPAAAIYGQTNPGGIVNFIPKMPKTRQSESFFAALGQYDTQRFEIESTGPVPLLGTSDNKLFYFINGSYFHRTWEPRGQATRTRSAYFALQYKFAKETSLTFDFDYTWQHNLVSPLPIANYGTTAEPIWRVASELRDKQYVATTDWNERAVYQYELLFEHRFNEIFSTRAAANFYRSPRYSYASVRGPTYNPATRTISMTTANRSPLYNFLVGDGHSAAVDFVASYEAAKMRHKTLLTVDYFKNIGNRPQWTANPVGGAPWQVASFSVDDPVTAPYLPFTGIAGFTQNQDRWDYAQTVGTFLRHQLWALDGRLIVMGGVRYDSVRNYVHNMNLGSAPGTLPDRRWSKDNIATTTGANYHIVPGVVAYASRSESFVPGSPAGVSAAAQAAEPFVPVPNQTGEGYEGGFKFDLFNHRLSITTGVYSIKLKNVQTNEINPADPTGPLIPSFEGGQRAKGFEIDANYQVTSQLLWLFSYGYTDSRLTDRGNDVDIERRQALRIPFDQLASSLRYDINRNWNVYLTMRYFGWAYVDTTAAPRNPATGLIDTPDPRRLLKSPAYAVWNIGAAYKFKTDGDLDHTINVTAKNIFDRKYYLPNRNVGDEFNVLVSYNLRH